MTDAGARELVDGLFRQESARLVAALARLLGPAHLALAEDVVQEALLSAMQAWRFGLPDDPRAWLLTVAKNRAIDVLRRERRLAPLPPEAAADGTLLGQVELAFSLELDGENQLLMMFAICDDALSPETHVSLILRLLCGLSASEIAQAFLVDVATIDRRLHRGRGRLQKLGQLESMRTQAEVRARQASVEQALYLLFNEGYHGSDAESPLRPALCESALRLVELLLGGRAVEQRTVHALGALFCFNAARLGTRLDQQGVAVPLEDQDRSRWDRQLLERGVQHLGQSATGAEFSRFHLEAGIAFEHSRAASMAATNWPKILEYYDALLALAPGPVVGLNRALAVAEVHGLDAGRSALSALAGDPKLASYSFYWAACADVERRAARFAEARTFYERAIELAKSHAERGAYQRRLSSIGH